MLYARMLDDVLVTAQSQQRRHMRWGGTVHPIVEERVFWLALGIALVAAPDHENRNSRSKLLSEVTAHLGLVRQLVAHDEHL